MPPPPDRIALSLVSHTNVGKTTLARTLLAREVGEVRDAPHVTEFADEHELMSTPEGDTLLLWDTPGFGDTARLLARLRGADNPLGWFLSQVWDRWRDRPFWGTQQVVRHVREASDVVLYLVNASEPADSAGYVAPEMDLLAWVGKPVIVLLNQLGPPRDARADEADVAQWTERLRRWPVVRRVLPLDAFARCWVQEGALWAAVEEALPEDRRAAMAALRRAWTGRRTQQFDASMAALAGALARLSTRREALDGKDGLGGTLRRIGGALGLGDEVPPRLDGALRRLQQHIEVETRAGTDALIRLHGLSGEATGMVLAALPAQLQWKRRVDEGPAALLGGLISGAATGLAADVAAGGLTLGGGMIAGGLLGAMGAAGAAHGLNVVRGADRSSVALGAAALGALAQAALLRYLAVAHYGRGRGQWKDGEAPAHWRAAVDEALQPEQGALASLASPPVDEAAAVAAWQALLSRAGRAALDRLYPGSIDNPAA